MRIVSILRPLAVFLIASGGWAGVTGCSSSGTDDGFGGSSSAGTSGKAGASGKAGSGGSAGKVGGPRAGAAGKAGGPGAGAAGKAGGLSEGGGGGEAGEGGESGSSGQGGEGGEGDSGSAGAAGATAGAAGQGGEGGAGGEASGAGQGGAGEGGQAGTSGAGQAGAGQAGSPPVDCAGDPNVDNDGDGFTEADGDCNDCDPKANPGAVEAISVDENGQPLPVDQQADEDCDGVIQQPGEPGVTCDAGLALEDADPIKGANAIDICKVAQNGSWGIVSAGYVRANGAPASYSQAIGIQPNFGPNVPPQKGERLLALSTGRARIPGQPGTCGSKSCNGVGGGTPPPGFPQDSPNCDGDTEINDDVALELRLKAPTNATGFKFRFKFYSFEYPEWVCTSFNDQFIALVTPPPEGSINGNISFDSQKNPVSVNIAYFEVCNGCPSGTAEMDGTGFNTWDDAGGTVWLETQAPIQGGQEFTIRFAIWDTGDQAWDSTTLIDKFEWIADGSTVKVETGKP